MKRNVKFSAILVLSTMLLTGCSLSELKNLPYVGSILDVLQGSATSEVTSGDNSTSNGGNTTTSTQGGGNTTTTSTTPTSYSWPTSVTTAFTENGIDPSEVPAFTPAGNTITVDTSAVSQYGVVIEFSKAFTPTEYQSILKNNGFTCEYDSDEEWYWAENASATTIQGIGFYSEDGYNNIQVFPVVEMATEWPTSEVATAVASLGCTETVPAITSGTGYLVSDYSDYGFVFIMVTGATSAEYNSVMEAASWTTEYDSDEEMYVGISPNQTLEIYAYDYEEELVIQVQAYESGSGDDDDDDDDTAEGAEAFIKALATAWFGSAVLDTDYFTTTSSGTTIYYTGYVAEESTIELAYAACLEELSSYLTEAQAPALDDGYYTGYYWYGDDVIVEIDSYNDTTYGICVDVFAYDYAA